MYLCIPIRMCACGNGCFRFVQLQPVGIRMYTLRSLYQVGPMARERAGRGLSFQ